MSAFPAEVIDAAKREHEVTLTTRGRNSGAPVKVTIWLSTDGERLFIRSGKGLRRHWPRNLLSHGRATLHLGELAVEVKPRHVTDPEEARSVSRIARAKYGDMVKPSAPGEPLTSGEQATFELLPAD